MRYRLPPAPLSGGHAGACGRSLIASTRGWYFFIQRLGQGVSIAGLAKVVHAPNCDACLCWVGMLSTVCVVCTCERHN